MDLYILINTTSKNTLTLYIKKYGNSYHYIDWGTGSLELANRYDEEMLKLTITILIKEFNNIVSQKANIPYINKWLESQIKD